MSHAVPLADRIEPVDPERYLRVLEERFGIAPATFAEYRIFQPNRRTVWLARLDLELPEAPPPFGLGIPFFYTNLEHPRPTTAAILRFGRLATHNVLELSSDPSPPNAAERTELESFLLREPIRFADRPGTGRLERATAGWVIARHLGADLGLGLLQVIDDGGPGERGATFQSLCPRSWAARSGRAADRPDDRLADGSAEHRPAGGHRP